MGRVKKTTKSKKPTKKTALPAVGLVSAHKFIQLMGTTRHTFNNYRMAGAVIVTDDGLVDFEKSKPLFEAEQEKRRGIREGARGKRVEPKEPELEIPDDADFDQLEEWLNNPRLDSQNARRIGEILKARKLLIEEKEASGELMRADDVKKISFKTGRYFRDAMQKIPVRISDQLAALSDPVKIEKLLKQEIDKALLSIHDGKQWGIDGR